MRFFCFLFGAIVGCGGLFWGGWNSAAAQTYQAGTYGFEEIPFYALFEEPAGLVEISVAGVGQSSYIVDPDAEALSKWQWGGEWRTLYYVTDVLALGVNGAYLKGEMLYPALSSLSYVRAGASAKLILTPQVLPREYLILETGAERRSTRDVIAGASRDNGMYVRLGFGLEFQAARNMGLFFEYAGVYSSLPNINKLMRREHRWEQQLAAGLSWYW